MTNTVLSPCSVPSVRPGLLPGELVLFAINTLLYESEKGLRRSERNDPRVKYPEMWAESSIEYDGKMCSVPVMIIKQCFRRGQQIPYILGYEVLFEDRLYFIKASAPYKRVK